MTADHDCRFCACVKCYPWDDGVHNFRHTGNPVRCSCDACPAEKPFYPSPGGETAPPAAKPSSTPTAPGAGQPAGGG
jgi:hypothetical protein